MFFKNTRWAELSKKLEKTYKDLKSNLSSTLLKLFEEQIKEAKTYAENVKSKKKLKLVQKYERRKAILDDDLGEGLSSIEEPRDSTAKRS